MCAALEADADAVDDGGQRQPDGGGCCLPGESEVCHA
jgi:hypothetical protein